MKQKCLPLDRGSQLLVAYHEPCIFEYRHRKPIVLDDKKFVTNHVLSSCIVDSHHDDACPLWLTVEDSGPGRYTAACLDKYSDHPVIVEMLSMSACEAKFLKVQSMLFSGGKRPHCAFEY
jgi:hypothetical protein